MSIADTLKLLETQVGTVVHQSDWFDLDQSRINAFGKATLDEQWIHVDVERATRESPYGGPIAHGFLTLSLMPHLRGLVLSDRPLFPGVKNVINYGLNKVRFPAAVPAGARLRAEFTLASVAEKGSALELVEIYTVAVEGQDRPACVAETIMRAYF